MENRDILVDTSIIIDFLRKKNKQNSMLWKIKENEFNCIISSITVFELYAGAITTRHISVNYSNIENKKIALLNCHFSSIHP